MRLTKSVLRHEKRKLQQRITNLCSMLACGTLTDEMKRVYPAVTFTGTDAELLRSLLFDAVDVALPTHWLS